MSKIIQNARIISKNTSDSNAGPTIPPNDDHTTGQWSIYDVYVSELFLNSNDDKLWIRTNNNIREILINDGLGDYNILPIFKNKNVLTKSIVSQDDNNSKIKVSGDVDITGQYLINGTSITNSLTGSSFLRYDQPFTANFIPVITANSTITNSYIQANVDNLTVNNYINTTNGYQINGHALSLNDLNGLYAFNNGLSKDVNNVVTIGGTLLNDTHIDSSTSQSLYIGSLVSLNEIGLYSSSNLYLENGTNSITLNSTITLANGSTNVNLTTNGLYYNSDLSSVNQFNNLWIPNKIYVDTAVGAINLTATAVSYSNVGYPSILNVGEALDQILYANPTASISMVVAGNSLSGTLAEKGSTITSLSLNWSVNKLMTTIHITGPSSLSVFPPLSPFSGNVPVIVMPTTTSTYNISATDSHPNTANGSATLTFTQNVYYGTSPLTSFSSSSDIMSLATSVLSTSKSRSFTIANGNNEYIYYCYPQAYGTSSFVVGGFGVGMILSVVSYTNNFGVTENYNVYRNAVTSNGSGISVVVT